MLNFEDHDWEELGATARRSAHERATTWKIAAGVAVGMLLGGVLVYVLDHGLLQAAVARATRSLGQIVRPADPAGAARPAPAASAAESPVVRPDVPDPSSSAPAGLDATAPETQAGSHEVGAAQPAPQPLDERKERAWARYYTKPAQCEAAQGRDTIVECANHYIRARREFEASYAAGKR
jgi:hypothetical protein